MKVSTKTDLSRLVVGSRRRFVVVGVWVLAAAALGPLAGRFEQAQQNEPVTFLPGGAESVKVLEAAKGFPSGEQTPAVAVFRDPGGLGPRGRAAVEQTRAELRAASIPGVSGVSPAAWSRDGTAAVVGVPIRAGGDADVLVSAVEQVRSTVEEGLPTGLEAKVTGPAGFSADASEGLRGDQLDAPPRDGRCSSSSCSSSSTAARSSGCCRSSRCCFAEAIVRGLGYAAGRRRRRHQRPDRRHPPRPRLRRGHGLRPAPDRALPRGAPARRGQARGDARRAAAGRAGHRRLGRHRRSRRLLCLSLARVNSTAGLGPVGAMGVAVAAVAMLTLLPRCS